MRRYLDIAETLLVAFATSSLFVFVLSVSYQVIARFTPFIPRFLWTEEISRSAFIWMLFAAAAAGTRRDAHFVLDAFGKRISPTTSRVLDLVVYGLLTAIGIYLVIGGAHFVEIGTQRISTTSGIQLSWIYAAVPVSGAFIALFSVEKILISYKH